MYALIYDLKEVVIEECYTKVVFQKSLAKFIISTYYVQNIYEKIYPIKLGLSEES